MYKKIALIISLSVLSVAVFLVITYSKPKSLGDYINYSLGGNEISYIDIAIPIIYTETEQISDKQLILDICSVLSEINIKSELLAPKSYSPTYGSQYFISLYNIEKDRSFYIQIMDEKHVVINGKSYAIVNDVNLQDIAGLLAGDK